MRILSCVLASSLTCSYRSVAVPEPSLIYQKIYQSIGRKDDQFTSCWAWIMQAPYPTKYQSRRRRRGKRIYPAVCPQFDESNSWNLLEVQWACRNVSWCMMIVWHTKPSNAIQPKQSFVVSWSIMWTFNWSRGFNKL